MPPVPAIRWTGPVRSGRWRAAICAMNCMARWNAPSRRVRNACWGGHVPDGAGAFYPPTVLVDVSPGMAAYAEELFGPVAVLIEAESEAEALRIANDTPFGLGGGIFTRDLEKGERLARDHVESGSVFVNGCVRSDPRMPFGGIGDSGYGRELSIFGIREFVNIKTVAVS